MAYSRRHAVKMKQWPLKNLLSLLVLNEIVVSCLSVLLLIKIGLEIETVRPTPRILRKQTSKSGSKQKSVGVRAVRLASFTKVTQSRQLYSC